MSRNTRYATRLRSEGRAVNAATSPQDSGGTPASPITAIRRAPGPSSVDEGPRQQGELSLPLANDQPSTTVLRYDLVSLSELSLLGHTISASTTAAMPTSQDTDVFSHLVQAPLTVVSSSSSVGESVT